MRRDIKRPYKNDKGPASVSGSSNVARSNQTSSIIDNRDAAIAQAILNETVSTADAAQLQPELASPQALGEFRKKFEGTAEHPSNSKGKAIEAYNAIQGEKLSEIRAIGGWPTFRNRVSTWLNRELPQGMVTQEKLDKLNKMSDWDIGIAILATN